MHTHVYMCLCLVSSAEAEVFFYHLLAIFNHVFISALVCCLAQCDKDIAILI